MVKSLESNWINGNDLGSQKAIAKSLVKLNLSAGNAAALAGATNVDAAADHRGRRALPPARLLPKSRATPTPAST